MSKTRTIQWVKTTERGREIHVAPASQCPDELTTVSITHEEGGEEIFEVAELNHQGVLDLVLALVQRL
jgi:hypothetical protein